MKRFIYLYFGNYRWARKFLGGRWVIAKWGTQWIQWNESELKEWLDWPMPHTEYECEDWG